ncbi:MAG: bifunctional glycosyltransferase family 2 protein/CDP-glycerol:glycerophosphate glycerophosphotransferase [Lachnospiraceae bacterium]|nr:bifunctional glycosyltransferase family 2 protein/CDP-glycerol:glycerophosphate glycerophosphotransferase [Lachnospiraceae bacterium]
MELSIIVPFHKGKNYLKDCLESISDQNIQDFETILVLDHVEEDVEDLLRRFEDQIDLKVVSLSENCGVAAARNAGLDQAEGKYLYFLDSDDYLMEETLYEMLHCANKNKADIVCGTVEKTWYKRQSFLEEYSNQEGEEDILKEPGREKSKVFSQSLLEEKSVLGLLIKRDLIKKYQIRFPKELAVYSDLPFCATIMASGENFVYHKIAVYVKRYHNDPIKLPSLDQKEIPDRHMQYVRSFVLARKAAGSNGEIEQILEEDFFHYFIQLYQKKFLPKQGQLLPGSQFKTVCNAMKQCDRERTKKYHWKTRKLLDGFWEEKEEKCIFYGTLILGLSKFKKSKTKGTALYRMIDRFFFQKLPVKNNWILFESYLGKNYADSCKYIYLYLDEKYKDQYKFIWVLRDTKKEIDGSAKKVKYMSLKHFYYAARSKYWVNNMRQPVWREKRQGQVFLETWHGTPLKRLVFDMEDVHSATATYKSDFYKQSRQWDYLLSDNSFSTKVFKSAFLFPEEKILQHGYPRNDILHWDNQEERAATLKKKLKIPTDKKTILYAPTWRDDEYYAPGQYKFQLALDIGMMKQALEKDYVLLLRTHYFIADQLDISEYEGFAYNVSHYDDVSEIYLISDVCITDYSSVFFDYANLKRPMLFYTYDLEKYRDILRGFYIDMEKEVPGPLLYTTKEVTEAILHLDQVEEVFRDRYEEFYRKYCCWDDGHASERIVKDVFRV